MTPQLFLACAACLGMSDLDIENKCFEKFGHSTGFRSHEEERVFAQVLDDVGRPSKWRNQRSGGHAGGSASQLREQGASVPPDAAASSSPRTMEDARFYRRPAS